MTLKTKQCYLRPEEEIRNQNNNQRKSGKIKKICICDSSLSSCDCRLELRPFRGARHHHECGFVAEMQLNMRKASMTVALWSIRFCRESSRRGATVSRRWTESIGRSSTSWPRSTAWRAWATITSPNATWSSRLTSESATKYTSAVIIDEKCGNRGVEDVPVYLVLFCFVFLAQGEVGLPELNPDFTDRARDSCTGSSSHRSYQTAQQQVSVNLWLERLFYTTPKMSLNNTRRRTVLLSCCCLLVSFAACLWFFFLCFLIN